MRAAATAFAALVLAGCSTLNPIEQPDVPKNDKLALTAPLPASGVPLGLTAEDKAMISLLHDRATVNCLAFKNKVAALFTIGGVTMTDGDILFAAVPTALAAAKVSTGPLAVVTTVMATLSPAFQKLVGLPAPATYAQSAAGLDTMYAVFTLSPGIAWGLNDPAQRAATLKLIRVGYQQACLSNTAMPTSSVYSPKTPAAAAPVQ